MWTELQKVWDRSGTNVIHDKLGDGANWKHPEGAEPRCNWPEWHWKQVCFSLSKVFHNIICILSRLEEEDKELESLSYDELSKTTTTEAYYPGLPLLAG